MRAPSRPLLSRLRSSVPFVAHKKGAAFVEYIVLMGALSVLAIPFVFSVGSRTNDVFTSVGSEIEEASQGGGSGIGSTPISSTVPADPGTGPTTPIVAPDLTRLPVPVGFPAVGPGNVPAPGYCPPSTWVWDPNRGVYQVLGVALPRTSGFRVGNWHTFGVHPDGGPDDPGAYFDVYPSYPLGYDWWGDYIGVRAYVWDAWMWTEYFPPGSIQPPDPGCPPRDASGVPERPVWSEGTGSPSGSPAPNAYGVGEGDFLMGTDSSQSLTVTSLYRGVNGLGGNDLIDTNSYSSDFIWIGAGGDDTMTSRNGNDLFLYRLGDGSDRIREQGGRTFASIYDLFYAQNIAYNDVVFGVSNADPEDLRVRMPDGAVVVLENHHEVRPSGRIDYFQFGNMQLTWNQVRDRALEDMKATGLVIGSTDANTFTHRSGDPSYTVRSRGIDSFARDNVLVFANADSDEVVFSQVGNSIAITSPDGSVVTLLDQLTETLSNRMDRVEFADGVSYAGDAIRLRMLSENAMSGTVAGGSGNGVYFFRTGNGNVSLSDSGGTDTVFFDGIASGDVAFGRVGTTDVLRIQHLGTGERLDIADQFTSTDNGYIENLVFTDRTYTRAQGIQRYLDDAGQGALGASAAYGNALGNTYTHRAADPSMVFDDLNGGGNDTVQFADIPYGAGSTVFGRSGNDLVITMGAKTVRLTEQFSGVGARWLETLSFSNGQTFSRAQALQEYNRAALAAGATAFGSDAADVYPYPAGSPSASIDEDALAGSGNDQVLLSGYNIADAVFARSGDNMTLTFSGGRVLTIVAQYSATETDHVEVFVFDDGAVSRASAIDRVLGSNLAGGGTVQGSGGNDEFVYFASYPSVSVQENNTGGTDTLRFADLNLSDLSVARTGLFDRSSDAHLRFTTPDGDTVTLLGYYSSNVDRRIETVRFADGQSFTINQMMDEVIARSIAAGGFVYGTWRNDTFTVPSTGPDVTIQELSTDGNDTVVFQGTASTDVLATATTTSGGRRDMTVRFPSGRVVTLDTVSSDAVGVSSRLENFVFTDGTLSAVQMYALSHVAAFASGGTAVGSHFNDTFIIPSSGPSAVIFENGNNGGDSVVVPIASTAVGLTRNGEDLNLRLDLGGGRLITITGIWQDAVGAPQHIESFAFSDGVTWSRAQISQQHINQMMASSATLVYGTSMNDTYTYARSRGSMTIEETSGGVDQIVMTDVASTEVTWTPSGSRNLIMNFPGGQITLPFQRWFFSNRYMESVVFSDGVSFTQDAMLAACGC